MVICRATLCFYILGDLTELPGCSPRASIKLTNSQKLTFFQLVVHYDQKGHRDHEEVEDKADLTQLTDGRPAHLFHYRLVGALTTDRRGVTQDDQATDQEHEGDLSGERRQLRDNRVVSQSCKSDAGAALLIWNKFYFYSLLKCVSFSKAVWWVDLMQSTRSQWRLTLSNRPRTCVHYDISFHAHVAWIFKYWHVSTLFISTLNGQNTICKHALDFYVMHQCATASISFIAKS